MRTREEIEGDIKVEAFQIDGQIEYMKPKLSVEHATLEVLLDIRDKLYGLQD